MADIVVAAALAYGGVIGGLVIWLHIRHTRLEEAQAKLNLDAQRDENTEKTIKRLSK